MKKLEPLPPLEVSSVNDPDPIWINCTATPNCPGTQALLVMTFKNVGTGLTYRYCCLHCNRPFHIQAGGAF